MVARAEARLWTVFVGYGAAFVAIAVVSTVVIGVAAFAGSVPADPEAFVRTVMELALSLKGVLLGTIVSSGVLAGVALVGGAMSPERLVDRLRLLRPRVSVLPLTAMLLGGVALSECVGALAHHVFPDEGGMLPILSRAIGSARGGWLVITLLVIGVVPGICEELFFRGYMQTRLRRRWGAWPAIAVAAAAFGIMHFDLVHTPITVLLGIYFGWIAERGASIWPAVGAHIVNNVAAVVTTQVFRSHDRAELVVLAASVVLFPAAVVVIWRGRVEEPG